MLKVEQVHVIRHKVLVEGESQRRVAREMGLSRNTVKKYLEVSEPKRVERSARERPVLERVKGRMRCREGIVRIVSDGYSGLAGDARRGRCAGERAAYHQGAAGNSRQDNNKERTSRNRR